MSINLLFPTSHAAESYKNIQVHNAIVDNNLTVNGSIIQPSLIRPILSSDYASFSINASTNVISGSELAFTNYSCITPVAITYASNGNINITQSGTYLINVQFVLNIHTYSVPTIFDLIFKDVTNSDFIADSQITMSSDDDFTISINRVAYLENSATYQVQLKQSTAQQLSMQGNNFVSFINMVKLF